MTTEPAHPNGLRDRLNSTRRGWRRRAAGIGLGLWFASAASLLFCGPAGGATLPAGFSEQTIGSGWSEVVGLNFATDGRTFVWERGGRVWTIENGVKSATPFLDIHDEVGGWRDFGLLGFCLDPNFSSNGHVYLFYVVDHHHLANFGTPNYNANTDEYFRATIGRITRYTARASDGFRSIDYGTRQVLLGETITSGFAILHESHGTGALVFGTDGTLLASCGDGASYSLTDTGSASGTYYAQGLSEGIIRPKENIGALRSQLVDSLNGKVIRIDPVTGDGVASNPFYDAANRRSARSRVWALGLRNPCRMTLRPGTGSHNPADANPGVLYIGDVGWSTWEDLNVCTGPGQNFGWPLYEGMTSLASYYNANVFNQDAPNPLNGSGGCSQPYFYFRDLLKQASLNPPSWPNPCNTGQQIPATIPRFVHTRPAIDWNHSTSGPSRCGTFDANGNATVANLSAVGSPVPGPNFGGNCSIGGVWYQGTQFPAAYRNTYFQADYGQSWIRSFAFDANDRPVSVTNFLTGGGGIVFVGAHPTEGSLYYISWATTIRKIIFPAGTNLPPNSAPVADQIFGAAPLTVQFTGTNSFDPEGSALTYAWNFGDGTTNGTANPSHTFNVSGGSVTNFTVRLIVKDAGNASGTNTLKIHLNNTPPGIVITSPTNGTRYPLTGDTVYPLTASVSDAEHPANQLSHAWQTFLHHNEHQHQEQLDTNAVSSTTISPVGCGTETYYYRVRLTVTDPTGLAGTAEVLLYPDCPPAAPTTSFTNAAAISIPDSGAATPYPSTINVSGLGGTITNVTVTLRNLTQTWASDVDVLLVGPTGQAMVLMSDCGDFAANNVTLTLSDGAASSLPPAGLVSGTFKPTNLTDPSPGGDNYPAPAPAGPHGSAFSTFNGLGANGVWSLYVFDDGPGDLGSFAGGWSLTITTDAGSSSNTPPTISGIANQVINEDNGTGPVAFTIADSETAAGSLTLGKGSSDLTLVPTNNIVLGGSGANRTVTVTPAANQSGSATITVTVGDGQYSASTNFTVTVNAVNDAPTSSGIANQTIGLDSTTGPLNFTVGDVETAAASLAVSGNSSNLALVPVNNLVFGGSGASRTVTVTPATGQSGTATITLTVSDGQLATNNSFVLTVSTLVTGTRSFTNAAAITIPDSGTASLYPSTINVSGLGGTVSNVTVSLRGLSHTRPDDIDMLLVGPGGQKAVIFSDAGGANVLANINVTLSDTGSALPNNNRINAGTYRPSNFSPADTFPSPAPVAPYSAALLAFNGQTPNGAWSLFVFDDLAGSSGSLAGGWSLTMTTSGAAAAAVAVTPPGPITIASIAFIDPGQLRLEGLGDANRTYTVETSADLIQWEPLGQTTADGAGAFEFVDDLVGGFNARFYRVTTP